MMTVKQLVLDTVRDLPDEVSWAELFGSLQLLAPVHDSEDDGTAALSTGVQQELTESLEALQRGLDDIRAGRVFDARSVIAELRNEHAVGSVT